ncbi:MAG: hypothetical protein R3305_12025 [Gammaproteobacteria bacterium]|nr:hypothetical protein [Gammaproteobacteria bacterium]
MDEADSNGFSADWLGIDFDANGDGQATISDVGIWLVDLALWPGNALLDALMTYAPGVATFLELSADNRDGAYVVWASILLWLAALAIAGTVINKIRELDRTLTAFIAGGYAEAARRARVLRRRVVSFVGQRIQARKAAAGTIDVADVRLGKRDVAVLRRLTKLDEDHVISHEALAAQLNCGSAEIGAVLRRLEELGFVERGYEALSGDRGHRITSSGQMYLVAQ